MAGIFISYRRVDSSWAGRVFDALRDQFRAEHVFYDTNIPPGAEFPEELRRAVGDCDVLLAVIGEHWVDIATANGDRRLDDPADWVRLEIETALGRADVTVIPLLIDHDRMPDAADLPPSLRRLCDLQAISLRNASWGRDVAAVIEAIDVRLRWSRRMCRVVDALTDDGLYTFGAEQEAPEALRAVGLTAVEHPPYLLRKVDRDLREALMRAAGRGGLSVVVLSGPSKAGKSRSFLEALRATLPQAWIIRPESGRAVVELSSARPPAGSGETYVLWLDEFEQYVGYQDQGINRQMLKSFADWRGAVIVAGTYKGVRRTDIEDIKDPAQDLLRDASEIKLDSLPTPGEREELTRHPTYAVAADRIARVGIGEFMIVATELRRKLLQDRSCPEGVAVTRAAIDWRRCGMVERPIALDTLEELHAAYLDHPPLKDLFVHGLRWATRPLYANVALLQRANDGYSPYDYAVRIADEDEPAIPRPVWEAVVKHCARDEELLWVGVFAAARGELSVAESAFRRADERGDAFGAQNLGSLLRQRGDLKGAEAAYRRAADRGNGSGANELGVLLIQRGDREGAEVVFRRADERGDASGATNLGRVLAENGDLEGAEAAYRRGDRREDPGGSFELGMLLHERGDVDAAEAAFRRADDRGSTEGAFNLGVLLQARGDIEGAIGAYRRADDRGSPDGSFNLGVLLRERGEIEDAEAAWRRADQREHALGAHNLGKLLLERGDSDAAEAAIRRADERGNPLATNSLGALLQERGDLDGAQAAYQRADEAGNALGAFNLGVLLHMRGDLDGAAAALGRAEQRGLPQAANRLGKVLEERGELDAAEAAFRRASETGDADGAHNFGWLLAGRGEAGGAEAAWRRADQLGSPDAGFTLGRLLAGRDDLDGAEAAWRRADARGHREAATNLGLLLVERGDLVGAEAAWRHADERGDAYAALRLGVLLHDRGEIVGAEAAFRRADERGNADGANNVGVMLDERGDLHGAEAAWRRADSRGHADAAFNLGLLLVERRDRDGAEAALMRAHERGHPDAPFALAALRKRPR